MEISLKSAGRKRLVIGAAAALCLVYLFSRAACLSDHCSVKEPNLASFNGQFRLTQGMPITAITWAAIMPWSREIRTRPSRLTAPPCNLIRIPPATGSISPPPIRSWATFQIKPWPWNTPFQADPTTPDVAWEAANFYLVQGDDAKALREFRVVLQNEPTLADPAIQFCWRINPDVDACCATLSRPRQTRTSHS